MKALLAIGVLLLVLGICSFFVGLPRTEHEGVKIGGAEIGVQTKHNERIPVAGSVALLAGGVLLIAVGARGR